MVTAWWSVSRSNSVSGPVSFAATSHACGALSSARAGAGDGERERAPVQLAAGREAAPSPGADPLAQLGAERRHDRRLGAPRGEHLAAPVVDQRRPADQRGQRARHAVEALLGEHDPLEPLVRRERATQERVLLVDEMGERLLGEGDERQLVGHLEEGEAVLLGGLHHRLGHGVVAEPRAQPDAREPVARQPRDVLALPVGVLELHPRGEQQLTAREPRRRVLQLGDVHPADRAVQPVGSGRGGDVELTEKVAEGQHRQIGKAGTPICTNVPR